MSESPTQKLLVDRMAAASGPSGPSAGALAETLAEEDAYARELAAWHSRFVAWPDAAFGVWAGDSVLVHPPKPPKTSRWSTQDEVLLSQRDAARIERPVGGSIRHRSTPSRCTPR